MQQQASRSKEALERETKTTSENNISSPRKRDYKEGLSATRSNTPPPPLPFFFPLYS